MTNSGSNFGLANRFFFPTTSLSIQKTDIMVFKLVGVRFANSVEAQLETQFLPYIVQNSMVYSTSKIVQVIGTEQYYNSCIKYSKSLYTAYVIVVYI